MFEAIAVDIKRNKHNTKGMIIVISFRLANMLYKVSMKRPVFKIISIPLLAIYKIFVDYILCAYIPPSTEIGPGFVVFHGYSIVINAKTVIGNNCTVRQCVTIGSKDNNDGACPKIGNNVEIGASAIIVGDIVIGDGATIGAGSVVVKNVPSGPIVAGNPASVLTRRDV
jgi:serine acetyltransferase